MTELSIKKFTELTIEELYEILKARVNVFVVEQQCPYPELDDIDQNAYHISLKVDGVLVAYLRVFVRKGKTIQIGRVLTLQRGKRYGNQIMEAGIKFAKQTMGGDSIYIEAQCYAIGFYEKFGFKTISEPFLEDGIPHVQMQLCL